MDSRVGDLRVDYINISSCVIGHNLVQLIGCEGDDDSVALFDENVAKIDGASYTKSMAKKEGQWVVFR